MSERDNYQPGAPNWIEIGSPDPEATAKFYSALFGWQVSDPDPDPNYGGYRMASINGRPVAGIGPAQAPGTPWWATYVNVEDADTTAKVVQDVGGQVLAEPFDVGPFGRMAVLTDPMGAQFSVWQPKGHIGAGLVSEHGTLAWNELHTRDPDRAKDFYSKVFGWYPSDVDDMGQGFIYTVFKLTEDENDQGVGGIMPMGENESDRPDHWRVYFEVNDADATAAKATELGGGVTMPPTTMEGVGRFAALTGPHGEEIMVISSSPATQG
jgi:predicted enzyme related to lactoylglutathione lyase